MEKKANPVLIVAQCATAALAFLLFATYVATKTQVDGAVPPLAVGLVCALGIGLMYWMQGRRVALGFRRVIIPRGAHPWDHAFDFLKKTK
jgi:hypothetical protein